MHRIYYFIFYSIRNWFILKALGIFKMKDKKEETYLAKTFDEICKSRNCSSIAKKRKYVKKKIKIKIIDIIQFYQSIDIMVLYQFLY